MASKSFMTLAMLGMSSVTEAFWRMECRGSTGVGLIDPIVDFGKVGSHAHIAHGSSGFSMTSTYDDLRNADCTSCAVKQDMSAYWTPPVYFQDSETSDFTPVNQVGGMLAYYLPRGENVKAFPPGFQMVAGSTLRRDYTVGDPFSPDPPQSNWAALKQTGQADLEQRAIGFNCLNYKGPAEPSLFRHYMPNKTFTDANCPDGLRFELMFPSCWNGELDSPDHKSHVAYPDLVGNGNCPDTHPQRLVTLFYETIWDTHNTKFDGKSGSFVIANGDRTGFGYHGDFISGWEPDFLQSAVDTCTNESGELTDCGVFTSNGPLLTQAEQGQCKFEMPEILAKENPLAQSMKSLPGGVQVQDGPQSATNGPVVLGTSTVSSPASTDAPAPGPKSGGAFIQSPAVAAASTDASTSALASAATSVASTSTSSSSPSIAATPATTPAPQAPQVPVESGVSYEVVSTQTVTSADKIEEIVWIQPVVYVTEGSYCESATTAAPAKLKMVRDHVPHHPHHARGRY